MRLTPAIFPASRTSHSPSQKSNWRCSGVEQGRGAGVALPASGGRGLDDPAIPDRQGEDANEGGQDREHGAYARDPSPPLQARGDGPAD